MPEIEPLSSINGVFAKDENVLILWQKTGTIVEVALRYMPRGLVYSVMLSRLMSDMRIAYGRDAAHRLLSGFIIEQTNDR